jgi:hypothetical protein
LALGGPLRAATHNGGRNFFKIPAMPGRFVETSSGARTTSDTTQSSGSLIHYVDAGPTLGRIRVYSGAVTGNMTYFVDNGPTHGRERSAT